jgi:oligosaccharyltransferase complex subunit alpha (ribophorin I)
MASPHHCHCRRRRRSTPVLPALLAALAALAAVSGLATATLVNVRVSQQIRPAGALTHYEIALRVRNDGPAPAPAVDLLVRRDLALLLVVAGDKLAKPLAPLPLSPHGTDDGGTHKGDGEVKHHEENTIDHCCRSFVVTLPEPLASGAEIDLVIAMQVTQAIAPVPAEIGESDPQYFRYIGSAYFMSPYRTETMETSIKLPSSELSSRPEQPVPVSVTSDTIKLGPYTNVPPRAHEPVSVRYRDDSGVFVAHHALRQMHISHWGNVAVKEEFRIENAGAKYVGRWSRVDYTERRDKTCPTAIGDTWANLPSAATNVLYKDLVGNITTSRLRNPTKRYRSVQLQFRFPLLGGWQNYFWYTYDVPLGGFSVSKGTSHMIAIPVFPSINERFLCRRLSVRVLLPEGASNVRVEPHRTIAFNVTHSVERTSLNYFGRPTVTLEADNLFTSRKLHVPHVKVSYDFPVVNLLLTPVIILAGIFALFLAYIAYANTDALLVSDEDNPTAKLALSVADKQNRIAVTCAKMDAVYAQLDAMFENTQSSDGGGNEGIGGDSQRMGIESSLKELESDIAETATELQQLGTGKAELASALARRFSSKRDTWMRAMASQKMARSGRIGEDEFHRLMRETIAPSLGTGAVEIDQLVAALTDDL